MINLKIYLANKSTIQSFNISFFYTETSSNSRVFISKINKSSSQHTQASSSKATSLIKGSSNDEDENDDDTHVNNSDEIEAEIPSESSDDEYIIETDDGIVKDTTSNSSVVWKYFKRVNYVSKKTKIKNPRVKCLHKVENGNICSKTLLHSSSSTTSMLNHLKSHGISDFPKKNASKIDNTNISSSKIQYYLLLFIISAALPFRCVENKYFKLFCKSLNPNAKLPSRQKISQKVTILYNKKKKKMINKLNDANSISLTTDCWTSVQNFSYIGVTAHLLDSNFKISSFC